MIRILTIEELAEDAFLKAEHLRSLEMMNTHYDFETRKKAYVALAKARLEEARARSRLEGTINWERSRLEAAINLPNPPWAP